MKISLFFLPNRVGDIMKKCLYPDSKDELCHEKAVANITMQKDEQPNLTLPVCEDHLNGILQKRSIQIELL